MRVAVTMPGTSDTFCPANGEVRVVPWMSWTRTESACAGVGRATIWLTAAALQTVATVSAARRAEDLLGKGSLRGRDDAPGRGWNGSVWRS